MNITNGTVSRTYRPADFEGRTITLSFSMDPGEDAEACIAQAVAMAERQARAVPNVGEKEPVQRQSRRPPAAVEVKAADPGLEDSDAGLKIEPEKIITDDELMKACQKATARLHDPQSTKNMVRSFVEKAGMSVITIPQKARKDFLVALDTLKVEG